MKGGNRVKLKVLFIANALVSVPFGIGSVLAPHLFLSLFGATLGPAGAVMMRYSGAWLVGIGLLTWFTRNAAESETGRGIAQALLISYLVALVVSVLGQLAGALNALGWMPVGIQGFFVAGLGYALSANRRSAASFAPRT
jgi:uncharacterized protein YjeT (DUF2065 family)